MKTRRCDFRRSAFVIGPRGGVSRPKTWRCSRKAKHPFWDEKRVYLCTQHLGIACGCSTFPPIRKSK